MLRAGEGGAFTRYDLGAGSWVDLARGFLAEAAGAYEAVVACAPWRMGRVFRYERWLDERRLGAPVRDLPGEAAELLGEARRQLMRHYRVPLGSGVMAYYRDGSDGMAFHRDRDLRYLEDTLVAILTLGGPRPFALRPLRGGVPQAEETLVVEPGPGDLLVMGGRCQADWQHSVPRQPRLGVPGRVSVQWRWTSGTGRPVVGPSHRAPRTYSPGRQ